MKLNSKIVLILLSFVSLTKCFAQDEVLVNLQLNSVIADHYQQTRYLPYAKMSSTNGYDTLPFIDDFSGKSPYPNPTNWVDKNVFINRTFPKAPVSIGVATFEGLDSTGYPYNFSASASSSALADYLTSQPIRLDSSNSQPLTPADSVYLSFYWQAAGRGDAPKGKDSLVLEFRTPIQNWTHIWTMQGYTPTPGDSNFYRVLIPVKDTTYFKKGFQFRFKNYATLSGNIDHWHIDYVYLNKGRSINDTLLKDVSFVYNAPSIIKTFQAMPYSQYNANFQDSIKLLLRNNFNLPLTTNFQNELDSSEGIVMHQSSITTGLVDYYKSTGFDKTVAISHPKSQYLSIINVNTKDTSSYFCKYYIDSPGDINPSNDTVVFQQKFYNYYAYDDGTAEAGYGLTAANGKLVYKVSFSRPDTFRGAYIYFSPILNNATGYNFRLALWGDAGGVPGTLIYKDSVVAPIYNQGEYNKFQLYKFTSGVPVSPGTYYIGWIQNTANIMNIGFDKNINNQTKTFYNTTGSWLQSNIKGSIMLRPALGKALFPLTGVNDLKNEISDIVIYPNPANDILYIERTENYEKPIKLVIIDMIGNELKNIENFNSTSINISDLPNGLYFIHLSDINGTTVKRLVITR